MDPNTKQDVQSQPQQPAPAAPIAQPTQQPSVNNAEQQFEAIPHADFPWTKVFFIICMIGIIFLLAALGLLFYTKNKQAMISNIHVQQIQSGPTMKVIPTTIPSLNAQVDKDFWRTDVSSFSAEELQSLQQLLLQGGEPQGGKLVVIYIQRIGSYGDLDTEIIDKMTNKPGGTEPGFTALYKNANNTWNLLTPSDPNFCSKLETFPKQISGSASSYFCSN